jgi:sugar lactone lactonase YvrE
MTPRHAQRSVRGKHQIGGGFHRSSQHLEGTPDGSTLDADGGLWCALVGGAQLARFTSSGLDRTLLLPVTNPTDVTFGGPSLGRLYVVSIGSDANNLDGALFVIDGLDTHGRAEPLCTLDLRLV